VAGNEKRNGCEQFKTRHLMFLGSVPGFVAPAAASVPLQQSGHRHFARNTWTDGERLSGLPLGSLPRGINSNGGMRMSKHTPGPWEWGDGHRGLYGQGEGRQREVLTFESYEGMWLSYTDNQEANARLIAAAPDLLEALECMIIGAAACAIPHPKEREVIQEAVNMAIAAKRKAKGEQDAS
jgi:hypothetical protein